MVQTDRGGQDRGRSAMHFSSEKVQRGMVACGVKTGNRTSEIDQMDDALSNLGTKAR